jgi:hypothetical protein
VGPFIYVISPQINFSRQRADAAVKFADSLARAFDVPKLTLLRYYLVRDGDEMLRLKGVEFSKIWGLPAGQSLIGIIISGDTVFGENHGHEIAHTVLRLLAGPNLHIVASEGVPSWLGGTRSQRFPAILSSLRAYLDKYPAVTLDSIIASNEHAYFNHASALLSQIVHEQRGNDGIRQFLNSGPSLAEFKRGVQAVLGQSWGEISALWRRRALGLQ